MFIIKLMRKHYSFFSSRKFVQFIFCNLISWINRPTYIFSFLYQFLYEYLYFKSWGEWAYTHIQCKAKYKNNHEKKIVQSHFSSLIFNVCDDEKERRDFDCLVFASRDKDLTFFFSFNFDETRFKGKKRAAFENILDVYIFIRRESNSRFLIYFIFPIRSN